MLMTICFSQLREYTNDLKAGVAIMALGALSANPNCGLKIVPTGMNYFHAHKFRSRAVIEFGAPLEVPKELVDQYSRGDKREAVRALLEVIYNGLVSVTVPSPDYDTLMVGFYKLLFRVLDTNKFLGYPSCEEIV